MIVTVNGQQTQIVSDVYSTQNEKILNGSTRFLEAPEIRTITLAPNSTAETDQRHDNVEELVIIKSGTVDITQNNTTQSLGPGSVALTLPGDTHSLANSSDTPATFYVLTFRTKSKPDLQRGRTSGGSFMLDRNAITFQEHGKGGIRRYYNRPTAMFERAEMHVTTLNQGLSSHDPHTHKADEIVLLVKGDAEMHINGKQIPAPEGSLVFLSSMDPHALTNTGASACEYFAFQWE
jgi:(S)-ureidoglycine aminohydrolase